MKTFTYIIVAADYSKILAALASRSNEVFATGDDALSETLDNLHARFCCMPGMLIGCTREEAALVDETVGSAVLRAVA